VNEQKRIACVSLKLNRLTTHDENSVRDHDP
jgi:hypothetical protein